MIQIDQDKCLNCGNCIKLCPNGVLDSGEKIPKIRTNRPCIGCLHCVAACPRQAMRHISEKLTQAPEQEQSPLEQLIIGRRAIRHFKTEAPERILIERALRMADWTPSSRNCAANRYVVLYGRKAVEKLEACLLEALWRAGARRGYSEKLLTGDTNLITGDAPCLIFGIMREDMPSPETNVAIAMTTLELLLCDSGIATCWGGYLTWLAGTDTVCRNYLGIKKNERLCAALMVGYSDEVYAAVPQRMPRENIWIES